MKFLGKFFHKISGSQEDNQASILDCPHLVFGRQGREDACYPVKIDIYICKYIFVHMHMYVCTC